ncbi:MAG: transcription antitermination factor NusB [Treponema sp.]|nr:transcription antitermination factor NusB [Treponema sp.]
MSRRKGRITAFQALFSWDANNIPLEDLLNFTWLKKETEESDKEKDNSKDELMFASLIVTGTLNNIEKIDELIDSHLSANWSRNRINKVALAILRTSIYELKFVEGSNPKIVIDEAINIAKEYGADDSFKFINAVLDKIGKESIA